VINHDDSNSHWYELRGNAYRDKNEYDQAISDYEAALRLDPNNAEYIKNLEEARRARGR